MEVVIEGYSSIEESPECMEKVFLELQKNPIITMVTLSSKTTRTYSYKDVALLREYLRAADAFKVSIERAAKSEIKEITDLNQAVSLIYSDPYEAYLTLQKLAKGFKKTANANYEELMTSLRNGIKDIGSSSLIAYLELKKEKYVGLGREIYKYAFTPNERSPFSQTLYFPSFPKGGELVSEFQLEDNSEVRIFSIDSSLYYYHVTPAEFLLTEEEEKLVLEVISEMIKNASLLGEENSREIAREIARDYLLKKIKKTSVPTDSLKKLLAIILRNTVGYGILDVLLLDDEIQDVYINRPNQALYIRHNAYEESVTNILPSKIDLEQWATKIKLENNKPLDETHPVLDGNLWNEKALARVSAMHKPLNTQGVSISIRRHREIPITLPALVKNGTIPSLAAAYLSIISLFGRSMLIAGSRGSGKTTLLGALMFEVPQKYRMVTIEDTLELPVESLVSNNYNVVSMKSKSFLSISQQDVKTSDALKASLRFGDSCLILGEVRGREVVALYEAMRVGALSNFVGGTLHAESPFGVYDRVVNDLGVKKASFKATDVIVMLSMLKSPSGITRKRTLTNIVEVKDDWNDDPVQEGAFIDLVGYGSNKYYYNFPSSLVMQKVAKNMSSDFSKEQLTAMVKAKSKSIDFLVDLSRKNDSLLAPEFVIKANGKFIKAMSENSNCEKALQNWQKEISDLTQ